MKRVPTYLLSLSIITMLFLSSCQKEVDFQDDITPAITGDMRCKIDGVQWVANRGSAATRAAGFINITGLSLDRKIFTITLTDSGVHRYILSDETINVSAHVDSTLADPDAFVTNYPDEYPANAGGEVNITSIDETNKRIKGTFSFKMTRSDGLKRNITEGSFDLSYASSIVLPPASANDTFRVKVNGTPFNIVSIFATATGAPINTLAVVANTTGAAQSVGLTFPVDITPGTYTLDMFGFTYIGQYNPDLSGTSAQGSTSGTLTILEHNTSTKRIRGNFDFHAQNLLNSSQTSELTEGYFSVHY